MPEQPKLNRRLMPVHCRRLRVKGTRGEAWGRGVWGEGVSSIQNIAAERMQLETKWTARGVDTQWLGPRTPEPLRGYWFPTNKEHKRMSKIDRRKAQKQRRALDHYKAEESKP
jgi:hypothetical protein